MPIYQTKCYKCGAETEIYRSVANREDTDACCGEKMSLVITAPMVMSDIQPYRSMIDGSLITSRSQHRAHLKAHGCVEVGNEPMAPKKPSWVDDKRQKESLRREIAARLDTI
jgi:hypothetical protein